MAYDEGQLGGVAPGQFHSLPLPAPGCPHPVRKHCGGEPITICCLIMEVASLKSAHPAAEIAHSVL